MTNPNVDKRSVATDALETLGNCPIPDNSGRDAIHLAVEPVVAGTLLVPGQDVGILDDGTASWKASKHLGIVDPFIAGPVLEGQRFWLVVYPRQITSLRHVWEHPDMPADSFSKGVADASKLVSEQWLRDFCNSSDTADYHTVIAAALNDDGWDSDYLHINGRDAHGDIPDEFWDHMEVVTGQKFPVRAKYFSCSC